MRVFDPEPMPCGRRDRLPNSQANNGTMTTATTRTLRSTRQHCLLLTCHLPCNCSQVAHLKTLTTHCALPTCHLPRNCSKPAPLTTHSLLS